MLYAVTGHDPDEERTMHRNTIRGDYGLGHFEGNVAGDTILEMNLWEPSSPLSGSWLPTPK